MGLLHAKVVVITGAGGGIGKCHALAFAAEGARVVVNDLGTSLDGAGQSQSMADQVVKEIQSSGGEAVANYDSVADSEGAKNIIRTAVDTFGRIDVLVNNAGILRDKTLLKMSEEMWDLVLDVHLKGSFLCTHAAAAQMREQGGGGRIINTTSYAGLKGNFGQSNYGAAKAGIYGLTLVTSMELGRFGITVNAIAPMAKTRMTENIAMVPAEMHPEQIPPIALFLASDLAADVSGRIFGIHGQQVFEYKMLMTDGVTKPGTELWTPAEVAEKLEAIGAEKKGTLDELRAAAKAAAPKGPSRLEQLMMLLPKAFVASKAGAWKANIRFQTGEEGTYSLFVESGQCRVEKGAQGTATCNVKTDPQTLAGLLEGTVDGQKAFMSGKLKIDKIGDMMKFQKVFDPSTIEAGAAEPATATTAVAATGVATEQAEDPIERAFGMLPRAFRPEKTKGWEANIHFHIKGGEDYSVRVTGGSCVAQKGLIGKPSSAVRTDAETLVGLFTGTTDPQKAFMARKIVVDNIGDMMKFARAFDFKAAQAEADAKAAAEAAAAAKAEPEGLNKEFVGKFYAGDVHLAEAEEMKAYAEAVGDRNPVYLDEEREGGIVAHPIFPVRFFTDVLEPAITEPELRMDILRMVHGEQEMIFHQPIRPKDLLYPTATFESVEDKSSGQLARFRQVLMREGRPVFEGVAGLFVRGPKKEGAKKKEETVTVEKPAPDFTFSIPVDEDQPKRYAEASGDHNPIHLDPDVAKAVGLPGVILHGLCSMAMAAQAVIQETCGGDPRKLRRIALRFSKPVLPGSTLIVRGWLKELEDSMRVVEFEVYDQDDRLVLQNGRAEVDVA